MASPLYRYLVLQETPIVYYPLEENEGFVYQDISGNGLHIATQDPISRYTTQGPNSFSRYARKSSKGEVSPVVLDKLNNKTFEMLFKHYGGLSGPEGRGGVILSTPNSGVTSESPVSLKMDYGVLDRGFEYVTNIIRFGAGLGDWDLQYDYEEEFLSPRVALYGTQFSGTSPLHDLWGNTYGQGDNPQGFSHLVITIDTGIIRIYTNGALIATLGEDSSDETISNYVSIPPETGLPLVDRPITEPLTLFGDSTGFEETYPANIISNFAIYDKALSLETIRDHYNAIAATETVIEQENIDGIIPFYPGEMPTIDEIEYVGSSRISISEILIESQSTITVESSRPDDFYRRQELGEEGFLTLDLSDTTLEDQEPAYNGLVGSLWFEIPFSSEDSEKVSLTVTAPNSDVRIRLFKAPFLDALGDDIDDILEDDEVVVEYSDLVAVSGISSDLLYTLEEDYGSNYFVQIGLVSGDGLDVDFEWGNADPLPGGEHTNPIQLWNNDVGRNEEGVSTNAFVEAGEPVSPSVAGSVSIRRSVWYSWNAPAVVDQPIIWSVIASGEADFTTEFYKVVDDPEDPYAETSLENLEEVVSGYSLGGGSVDIELTPEPSARYMIKVGTNSNSAGISLIWSPPVEEVPASEPYNQVRVTVHAGAAGAVYGGQTYAPNEFISELPNRTGLQFQEALNTPGTGSITLLQNDPVLRAYSPPGWGLVGDPSAPNLSGTSLLTTTSGSLNKDSKTITVSSPLPSNIGSGVTLQLGDSTSAVSKLIKITKRNSSTSFTISHNLGAAVPSGTPIYTTLQPEDDPFRLLKIGNFVKFWIDEKCVSGFVIKNREIPVVSSGEDAEKTITVTGPTFLYLLNDIVVMHDETASVEYNSEDRFFAWNSPVTEADLWANGGWFDTYGNYRSNKFAWNHPIRANGIKNPPGWRKRRNEGPRKRPKYAMAKLPKKKAFPDPKARWMWMSRYAANRMSPKFQPDGFKQHYYRAKKLNITKAGRYRITVNSDTQYEIYLDGILIMSGNGLERYTSIRTQDIYLRPTRPDNPNSLCMFVGDQNNSMKKKKKSKKKSGKKHKKVLRNTKKDADHNDAIILTVQRLNKARKPQRTAVLNSGDHKKWYAYHGPNPPSWSRAQILMTLLREGAERNNDSAKLVYNATKSVTPNLGRYSSDKGGGRAYWWDLKKYSSSIKVGTSLLDVQSQFSEIRKFDVWIDPDTMQLYAWQGSENGEYPRGKNRSANVALVPGQNLISYGVTEVDQMVNTLLVQYSKGEVSGFVTVEPDVNSPQGDLAEYYGTREGYFEAGGYHSEDKAVEISEALLTSMFDTTKLADAQDIVGHVNETYAGSIIPVKGSVPFLDFNVGDTISAPGYNGIMHPHRVLSLTCTEDDEGNLVFEPELEGS